MSAVRTCCCLVRRRSVIHGGGVGKLGPCWMLDFGYLSLAEPNAANQWSNFVPQFTHQTLSDSGQACAYVLVLTLVNGDARRYG